MDYLFEIVVFLAKALVVVAAITAIVSIIAGAVQSARGGAESLEVRDLNDRYTRLGDAIQAGLLDPRSAKKLKKRRKREAKERDDDGPFLFVLDFDGDVSASNVEGLREEISGILQVAASGDEVLIRIESAGGTVTGYGLAAAQLGRLREAGVRVIAAIDTVAASGGYMMACTADHILAAPFAIVGSIGVLAIVPNASRALDNLGVDVHEFTAGRYKRTVTPFGPVTAEGREKFLEELGETHALFKDFVHQHRSSLDIERVATGEYWHAAQAISLGLVDELRTSDDYLMAQLSERRLVSISYTPERSLADRLPIGFARAAEAVADRFATRGNRRRLLS